MAWTELEDLGYWIGGDRYVATIKEARKHKASPAKWALVQCDCGKLAARQAHSVRSGKTTCCLECNPKKTFKSARSRVPAKVLEKYRAAHT